MTQAEVTLDDVNDGRVTGRVARVLGGVLEGLAVVLMVGLTVLVLSNALGRYLFARPLPWTEEVVVVLLAWQMAVGIVLAGMRQSLITCDILLERLPTRLRRVTAAVIGLAGAAAMAWFAVLSWQYLMVFGDDLTPILKMPKGLMISALFFAGAGLALALVAAMFPRRSVPPC